MDQNEELARMKEELNVELTRHDVKMNKARLIPLVFIQHCSNYM